MSFFLQAEGFHGELEEFLQWLRRTESQLSAAKPTGGLPETAREQLQQHMVTHHVARTHTHTPVAVEASVDYCTVYKSHNI